MKIAITADVHLTNREKHPERFHALEYILDQCVEQGLEALIIAGDLFDASSKSPGEFEQLAGKAKYTGLPIYIIPGNHDPLASAGAFTAANIQYISRPEMKLLSDRSRFLFIPYQRGASISGILSGLDELLRQSAWHLVCHGDWLSGAPVKNDYEDGLYMPLSGRDLQLYQPRQAFLGHIHLPIDAAVVHYPGSPCGLDPTETGFRSFLVYDTESGKCSRQRITTDVLHFMISLTVIPVDDEAAFLRQKLEEQVSGFGLSGQEKSKSRLRISLNGYSTDRQKLVQVTRDCLRDFPLLDPAQIDVSRVSISSGVMQAHIAENVQKAASQLVMGNGPDEPARDDLILSALNSIYGDK